MGGDWDPGVEVGWLSTLLRIPSMSSLQLRIQVLSPETYLLALSQVLPWSLVLPLVHPKLYTTGASSIPLPTPRTPVVPAGQHSSHGPQVPHGTQNPLVSPTCCSPQPSTCHVPPCISCTVCHSTFPGLFSALHPLPSPRFSAQPIFHVP